MAWNLLSTKLLLESMMTYVKLNPKEELKNIGIKEQYFSQEILFNLYEQDQFSDQLTTSFEEVCPVKWNKTCGVLEIQILYSKESLIHFSVLCSMPFE